MIALLVVLGLLMMSHVPYPVVPKFGVHNARGILTGLAMLVMIALAIWIPSIFFFPALLGYVAYGLLKSVVLGFLDRLPDDDPLLDEEPGDEAGAELREIDYGELSPRGRRRPRRRIHDNENDEHGSVPFGDPTRKRVEGSK
jgi:CDP-diacylglycerol--serine O-phosphatidyltransferase